MNFLKQVFYFAVALLFAASANASDQTINNSTEALAFLLAEDRVPNAANVKLEKLKTTMSSKTKQWRFTFRDEDKQYVATVNAKGNFEVKKEFEETGDNPDFWSAMPAPNLTTTPEQMLDKAKQVAETFNSTFNAQDRAIIEYEVCKPPKKGTASKYINGCKDDKPKERWSVSLQIESQGTKFFRNIKFINGEPMNFSSVNVFGNW